MRSFAEQIRAGREEKGMSQDALGKMLGVSQQTVAQWESGKAHPRKERQRKLLYILGQLDEPLAQKKEEAVQIVTPIRSTNLSEQLPADLHGNLNREIRMGGGRCTVTYISSRLVLILYERQATRWEDLAPDILRLAVASHLNDAQGHHKDCVLAVLQPTPSWPQDIQGAMFGAGILGVTIQFARSLHEVAQTILSAEGRTT